MVLRAWRRRLREYDEITNVRPIIRRYFVIGAFDGALTVLGIIIGASAFGDLEAHKVLVVSASFGAAIALAVSSAVGAYEAERVEKKLDIRTIERAMLARLSEEHQEAFRFAAILSAIVHGIAPLIAGLLPVIPFLVLDARTATVLAVIITLVILFALGAYLGNLVRERVLVTGMRFAAAGIGTALILWLLGARLL
ncbi:MAG TPA: VIT1/CCC1 transporter family protein [Thermoplasmata archaeon]|jgi:predicted membrane protein (TIGR00267 family)|nr:VIT1/CCC1 transporter family protein [Thermoplasmata archaeon]